MTPLKMGKTKKPHLLFYKSGKIQHRMRPICMKVLSGSELSKVLAFDEAYWLTTKTTALHICDPTPANEALCGKIHFEL